MNSLAEAARAYPLPSEALEPFAARIIGALGMRVETVKEDPTLCFSACTSLWWAVRGLDHIAIAARSAPGSDDPTGLHFSLAMSAERSRIAHYIKDRCGCDPEKHPSFQPLRRS